MTITLEILADRISAALRADASPDGRKALVPIVAEALTDPAFVATYLPDRAPGAHPRSVLFEDPELGFCICGHVYDGPAEAPPHDHGSSWAIYGQATGETEMTDWEIVAPGDDARPAMVKPVRTYTLKPGDAHVYDIGVVHSPKRFGPTRLIRIEGANLDHVQRSNIAVA